MPSKFDKIFHKLSPLPPDPSFQDKVSLIKEAICKAVKNPSGSLLAKGYIETRNMKAALEAELDDVNLTLEAYSQLLANSCDSKDSDWGKYGAQDNMLRLESGDKIEIRKEPYAQVVDKDGCREWAIKNGYERMLGLPWQTLNSITKERLLKGESEPDGVQTFVKTKVVFTTHKEK